MKTLTLKLPDALDRQLTVLVSQRGVNKSVLIREAIERYLSDSKAIQAGSFLDLAGNLLKVYRFDQLEHYLSCIFNGLRRLRKDHGIYSVASLRES